MNGERQNTGKRGEDEACTFLLRSGHSIVARNWRYSHLEVDIISRDGDGLHFVEVKTRNAPLTADPQDNVDWKKMKRLASAARAFRRERREFSKEELFFDVISVVFEDGKTRLEYFPQAFVPMYV